MKTVEEVVKVLKNLDPNLVVYGFGHPYTKDNHLAVIPMYSSIASMLRAMEEALTLPGITIDSPIRFYTSESSTVDTSFGSTKGKLTYKAPIYRELKEDDLINWANPLPQVLKVGDMYRCNNVVVKIAGNPFLHESILYVPIDNKGNLEVEKVSDLEVYTCQTLKNNIPEYITDIPASGSKVWYINFGIKELVTWRLFDPSSEYDQNLLKHKALFYTKEEAMQAALNEINAK